jgi:hypothetical protein
MQYAICPSSVVIVLPSKGQLQPLESVHARHGDAGRAAREHPAYASSRDDAHMHIGVAADLTREARDLAATHGAAKSHVALPGR